MRLSLVLAFLAAIATLHGASTQNRDGPQAITPVDGGAVATGELFFGLARARTLSVTIAEQPGPAEILVRRR